MKKCHLICNLESGKGIKKKDIDTIISLIKSYDYDVTLHITEKSGDATSIVKKIKTCDLVLSIGGDGTFNEIVTGNYQRKDKLLLSHIPVGTTNDIGTMLGMNKNIVKSVKDILNGTVKQMDIGLINDQPFIYVAGFGKFINVPYETERKLKKSLGHLAYLINGFKEFFQITKLYDIEYEIDGVKERGLFSLILISNANHIAGFNNIYKNVKLDDEDIGLPFLLAPNNTGVSPITTSSAFIMRSFPSVSNPDICGVIIVVLNGFTIVSYLPLPTSAVSQSANFDNSIYSNNAK